VRYDDAIMTGRTLAHFEMLEKLGEGGMGLVYKGELAGMRFEIPGYNLRRLAIQSAET
jgi:hypothetical protein